MASKPAASKTPPKTAKPALKVVADGEAPEKAAGGLKLKDLVDRVVASSGAKKKEARAVVEATVAEIGRVLAAGEGLNMPGLGKLRVVRMADESGAAMTLKLRLPGSGEGKAKTGKDTLAEGGDQG